MSINYAQEPGFLGLSVTRSPEDEKQQVWKKLQTLRSSYLEDMIELYGMLTARSNQPMPAEQLQKLKHYKDVLHRMIPYLRPSCYTFPASATYLLPRHAFMASRSGSHGTGSRGASGQGGPCGCCGSLSQNFSASVVTPLGSLKLKASLQSQWTRNCTQH